MPILDAMIILPPAFVAVVVPHVEFTFPLRMTPVPSVTSTVPAEVLPMSDSTDMSLPILNLDNLPDKALPPPVVGF